MAARPPLHSRKGVDCEDLPPSRIVSWGGERGLVSLKLMPLTQTALPVGLSGTRVSGAGGPVTLHFGTLPLPSALAC